jgi:hypothetical protein
MKRTDLKKWSQIATAVREAPRTTQPIGPIRVLDFPEVTELERYLLLYAGSDEHQTDQKVEAVSRQLFGIIGSETEFKWPEEYWKLPDHPTLERYLIEVAWRNHEDQFETSRELTDDETVDVLSEVGLDFTDGRGQPLRCTKLLARAAEAAAKGIKGKMPERQVAQLARFEEMLTKDREAFLASKRRKNR